MEEVVVKAKAIALKHSKEMAKEMISEIVFEALKMAAKKSETPVDDAIVAVLEAPLKAAALELIEKIEA